MSDILIPTPAVTDAQKEQYREQGYFLLEQVIPPHHLASLCDECGRFIAEMDAEMDRQEVTTLGINHKGSRYFVPFAAEKSPSLHDFVYSRLMADICRATIGEEAFLFLDQYVVKAAERGMSFSWHQDEGYIPYDNPPYVGCWCALDDVTVENGTIYVLPYAQAGTKTKVQHRKDEKTNDMVGYFGEDTGIPIIAPAGSIAVFSSTTFHRSGPNLTDKMRRIYLVQYSAAPIHKPDGSVHLRAEPFLKHGQVLTG